MDSDSKNKPLGFCEATLLGQNHCLILADCILYYLWMVLLCLLMERALAFLEVEGAFFDAFFYIRHIKEIKGVRLLYTYKQGPAFLKDPSKTSITNHFL